MRAFDSAADTYKKVNSMLKDLSIAKVDSAKSNGFFSRPQSNNNSKTSEYVEIKKVLLLTNAIKKQRESINGTS